MPRTLHGSIVPQWAHSRPTSDRDTIEFLAPRAAVADTSLHQLDAPEASAPPRLIAGALPVPDSVPFEIAARLERAILLRFQTAEQLVTWFESGQPFFDNATPLAQLEAGDGLGVLLAIMRYCALPCGMHDGEGDCGDSSLRCQ